ncbi:MAG TPA: hypothetical protein VIJ60_05795, partial [Acidimicrobiales bacterium]
AWTAMSVRGRAVIGSAYAAIATPPAEEPGHTPMYSRCVTNQPPTPDSPQPVPFDRDRIEWSLDVLAGARLLDRSAAWRGLTASEDERD